MTMMLLLPAISSSSSNAAIASLNSNLASSPFLRNLVRCCSSRNLRRKKQEYKSLSSRVWSASNLMSDESQVMVKGVVGKPSAPVLLLDVMGTLVRDPFYEDIPAFFGMTMKELLAAKHPTAWIEFECGHLSEEDLLKKFFADGRDFDIQGLKECMRKGYIYLEGVEGLLQRLLSAGFTMHAFSNYPCWYAMIEDKLQLSNYVPWTFISCHMGLRKPESEIYLEAARQLKVDPSSCVFVDDRRKNVEAAVAVGMRGIVFQSAKQLEEELVALGCSL